MPRVLIFVPGRVEILDLAGPLQVLHEAVQMGAPYELSLHAERPEVESLQALRLAGLRPLEPPRAGDLVLVPGGPEATEGRPSPALRTWLWDAAEAGARLLSVCTGAFLLGAAGLLDGRECTTHWARVEDLQRRHPRAKVRADRLFVVDGPLTTSAGIASGIDMALDLLARDQGPHLAAAVAREMVVHLRRDGGHGQGSVYLDHRSHLNPGVHRVQDWLQAHPDADPTLEELAGVAGMSVRSLTRQFRQAAGVPVQAYRTRLALERAGALLADPRLTLEAVAERCGLGDARRLRRLWRQAFGGPPSAFRP